MDCAQRAQYPPNCETTESTMFAFHFFSITNILNGNVQFISFSRRWLLMICLLSVFHGLRSTQIFSRECSWLGRFCTDCSDKLLLFYNEKNVAYCCLTSNCVAVKKKLIKSNICLPLSSSSKRFVKKIEYLTRVGNCLGAGSITRTRRSANNWHRSPRQSAHNRLWLISELHPNSN